MSWLWWRPPYVLKAGLVNLKDDTVIGGVIWQARGPWLVLRDAELLKSAGTLVQPPAKMTGETVIHRSEVLFVQVP